MNFLIKLVGNIFVNIYNDGESNGIGGCLNIILYISIFALFGWFHETSLLPQQAKLIIVIILMIICLCGLVWIYIKKRRNEKNDQ